MPCIYWCAEWVHHYVWFPNDSELSSQQSHGEWCQERRCYQRRHCAPTIAHGSEFLRVDQRLHVTTPEIIIQRGEIGGPWPATLRTVGVLIYYLLLQTYGASCRLTVCKADSCSGGRRRMGIYLLVWAKKEFLLLWHSIKTKLYVVLLVFEDAQIIGKFVLSSIHIFHPFKESYYLRNAVELHLSGRWLPGRWSYGRWLSGSAWSFG